MIILVDGPDGAGKSTFISAIFNQFMGVPEIHHFGAPKPGEDQFMRYAFPMTTGKDKILIYDRTWISEFVYGPIMRGRYELSLNQADILDKLALTHGGIVIHMTADVGVLWERCISRGETYIKNIEQLEAIKNEYERVVPKITALPVIRMDTTTMW